MLNYSAHIQGGHYAVESIPAGGSVTIDLLASSYNGVTIYPIRAFVSNYANDGQISASVAGIIASIVPSYANKNIEIQGLLRITFVNDGSVAANVMIADEKMLGIASDVYATLNISTEASKYGIVNNFEIAALADLENEGLEADVTYTVIAGTKIAGDAAFGDRCLINTDISGADTSGLIITKADYFDMSHDFTLAFWVYTASSWPQNDVVMRIGSEQASLNNSITVYGNPGASGNFVMNYFGTVTGGSASTAAGWVHTALCKVGNNLYFFFNGSRRHSVTLASPMIKLDSLGITYAGLNNLSYQTANASIDGLLYLDGIGLWSNSSYTVPSLPPV